MTNPHLDSVVSVVIHPAIGIARVGNSPEAFFLAPEVPGPQPAEPDGYRDPAGRIKRQAQRFRIFGRGADGEVICEITAKDAEITWTVQVANRKSAWYDFDQALDIPASASLQEPRRNAGIRGAARKGLAITPPARSIAGTRINADGTNPAYGFSGGSFMGTPVELGELRTDEDGNLLFLGGHGVSGSYDDSPLTTFANNETWHDDISDGPVDAVVRIGARTHQAIGAWVLTAPPDYAPGVKAVVTGHELMMQPMIELDPGLAPCRPRFSSDVYPLLAHFPSNQWVNAGFLREFGHGRPSDFTDPALLARLNDPGEGERPLREAVLQAFRNPRSAVLDTNGWPPYYGDAVAISNVETQTDPLEFMPITEHQYTALERWADGDFDPDGPPVWKCRDEMTPAERATGMDRAALDMTLGGPFHPGCEFTWPLRQAIMWENPADREGPSGGTLFRLKRRTGPEPDWGDALTPVIALAERGPLDGSGPGDVSRWMAVPWQTDTGSCLSAYLLYAGQYLPTFWPARVPNDVLTQEAYDTIVDADASAAEKSAAFSVQRREKWLRGVIYIPGSDPAAQYPTSSRLNNFVAGWDKVGIIVQQPGPDDPAFPETFWVENGRQIAVVNIKPGTASDPE